MRPQDLPSPSPDERERLSECRNAAKLLYHQGSYNAAIDFATGAVQLARQIHGEGDPAVAEDFGFLGLIYKAAGVQDRAEDCYRYAIDVLRKAKGEEDIELAHHLNNLGVLYKLQGRYEDAAPLYEQALRLRRAKFGEQSLEVVNSLSNIAALLEATGDENAALSQYLKALQLARGMKDQDTQFVTSLLNNLGNLFARRNQWHRAEPLLREALDQSTRERGDTHPATALMQYNLAEQLLRQRRPAEAAKLLVPALTSLRASLAEDHRHVQLTKASLAMSIKELTWVLETADPPLGAAAALAQRNQLSEFTRILESREVETSTESKQTSPDKLDESGTAIEIDLSGVEEALKPAVMQALSAFIQTRQNAEVEQLMNDHPELRPVLEPIVSQVRAVDAAAMGGSVPDLIVAIGRAANADQRAALCRKALTLIDATDRPDLWFSIQFTLAASLADIADSDTAEHIEDAIAALNSALAVDSGSVPPTSRASALSSLGLLYRRRTLGDDAENTELAIEAYESALAIPEHRSQADLFAATQNNLGNVYSIRTRGSRDENLARAVFLFEQVLRVTPRDAAPDEWARTQNNLGCTYAAFQRRDAAANRERAIEAFRQALSVRTPERTPAKWAETMVNLGNAWRQRLQGERRENLSEARASYRNALKIWTPESDPQRHFGILNMLGVTCLEDRDAAQFSLGPSMIAPEQLIPLTNEELDKILADYPELSPLLEARRAEKDLSAQAVSRELQLLRSISTLCLIERAVDRKRYLALHPELATERAVAAIEMNLRLIGGDGSGDWGEASLALLEESRLLAQWRAIGLDAALRERIEFEELADRAALLAAELWKLAPGDADAPRLITEAAQADNAAVGRLGSVGTELQRRRFLPRMRDGTAAILAAILPLQADYPELSKLGMDLVLRRKNVESELWSRFRDVAAERPDDAASQKYAELLMIRRRIAERILAVAEDEDARAFRKHMLELRVNEEELEIQLGELAPAADLGARLARVDSHAVSAAMSKGSALVEYVRLRFRSTEADSAPEVHYFALVLAAGQPDSPRLIDLGVAQVIDVLVAETRTALTGEEDRPADRSVRVDKPKATRPFSVVAKALRSAVFDPVREHLGGAHVVYLSPDGELARLPFAILPTEGDRYLIDDYEFRYVGAGRDLLRFGSRTSATRNPPVVAADPDFDLQGSGGPQLNVFFFEDLFDGIAGLASPRDRPLEKPGLRFDALTWGRAEGKAVAQRLGVKPLVGKSALKPTLMACQSPRILHLATHGFFLEDEDPRPRARDDSAAHRLGMRIVPRQEDPLMRSWLVFAGVNAWLQRQPVPDDAGNCVITAMEAATMNLGDTELVVLSACESGLGVIQVGEGVLGLRRAFSLAGAQTVIMTLWEVPDRYTKDVIVGFYDRALSGAQCRSSALREAQLALKEQRPDPYFWGAFVCEGEPGLLTPTKPIPKPRKRAS